MSFNTVGTVALVGHPNCGKSTLFNAITGSTQKIGNWPGVTIERKSGFTTYQEKTYEIIDTPGIYELNAESDDEKTTLDYLKSDQPDLVVNIVDASRLYHHLYLTTQLLEMGMPVLLALNMVDITNKQGITIDLKVLEAGLGCPVIAISGIQAPSALRLQQEIARNIKNPSKKPLVLDYPEPIIRGINGLVQLSRSEAILQLIAESEQQKDATSQREQSIASLVAQTRHNFIRDIAVKACTPPTKKQKASREWSDVIDSVMLHPWLSLPVFFLTMFLLFSFVQSFGSHFVDFFDASAGIIFVDYPGQFLSQFSFIPDWVKNLFVYGIGGGIQAISGFIPVVFLMFFSLGILEQSGYLARSAFVMDRLLQTLGLPGKSFIPLLLGFGCTTTAIMATRGLNRWNEKLVTIFMAPLMSCSARMPVYAIFAAAFFGHNSGWVIFSLYILGIVLAIATGLLFGKTVFRSTSSYFLLELPRYHWPRLSAVLRHAFKRSQAFFWRSGKILVMVMAVIGTFNTITPQFKEAKNPSESILSHIGRGMTPVFSSFGVQKDNWPAGVALVVGLFAKESVISSLGSLYLQSDQLEGSEANESPVNQSEESSWITPWQETFDTLFTGLASFFLGGQAEEIDTPLALALRKNFPLGPWQVYAYLVFILLYVPCVGAVAATVQEIGIKASVLQIVYLLLGPWAIATLIYQVAVGHSLGYISLAVGILMAMCIGLWLLSRYTQKHPNKNFWISK